MRLGAIGLDTSHAPSFAALLNDPKNAHHVAGAKIVTAYPGGSSDIAASAGRVKGFTAEMRDKWGVEILDDVPSLCARVDAVLLLSVDGRVHLEQVRPVFAAKRPVFIDKPLAASVADAREIFRLAAAAKVPVFTASALRFSPGILKAKGDPAVGAILGCESVGPCSTEPHHPDLFWYGIHGVEILFALMGPGCESVSRTATADTDLVVGRWRDGRIGSFRGIRKGSAPFAATVFGEKSVTRVEPGAGPLYQPLLEEVVKFLRTGVPPVAAEESLEVLAFMEAADASKREGGKTVALGPLLGK